MLKLITFITLLLVFTTNLYPKITNVWNALFSTGDNMIATQSIASYNDNYIVVDPTTNLSNDANKLRLSTDGGLTWEVILESSYWNVDENFEPLEGNWETRIFNAVEHPSDNYIYMLGLETLRNKNLTENYPYIMRTSNLGESWERVELCNDLLKSRFNYISMYDSLSGFIYTSACDIDNQQKLYKTNNGFDSFEEVDLPKQIVRPTVIESFNAAEVVIGNNEEILVTLDGGQSWNVNSTPQNTIRHSVVDINTIYSLALESIDDTDLNRGLVYKSSNAGQTWELLFRQENNFSLAIDEIDFLNEERGIIAGRDKIYTTEDGGLTWNLDQAPIEQFETNRVDKISYGSANHALINSRFLLRTSFDKVLGFPDLEISEIEDTVPNFRIQWDDFGEEFKYQIQISEFPFTGDSQSSIPPTDFEKSIVIDIEDIEENQLIVNDYFTLQFKRDYYVRIRAYSIDDTSNWSIYSAFQTGLIDGPLEAPTLFSPENGQSNIDFEEITFQWEQVLTAKLYAVVVSLDSDLSTPLFGKVASNIESSSITFEDFEPNTKYYWQVTSFKDGEVLRSEIYSFITSDLLNVEENKVNYILFPNPTSNIFNISDNSEITKVTIIDYKGKEVLYYDAKDSYNVSKLVNGVYFIEIELINGSKKTMRIIKTD